ncbi:MAG: class I SAM-dependent methyltransferase [Steroidobacteraceae bacterium]
MTVGKADQDQAGQGYWDQAWSASPLPALWPVDSRKIGAHVERALFAYMADAFALHDADRRGKLLIEAGCARSGVLPLFAKKLGFWVSGIDYSPNGCEQTRLMLEREGIQAEVHCLDVFSIPDDLVERYDVLVSFGLIEHFSDTTAIVAALARLIKPGGLIFTNVPNMFGVTGFLQKVMDKDVFDIHVPLSAEAVRNAHELAGLQVVDCDYFLSVNLGVVNLNSIRTHSLEWWIKKIALAVLVRLSMAAWWWERLLGQLPVSRAFSPYVNCIATKPGMVSLAGADTASGRGVTSTGSQE